jgi:hypothetical protein
MFECCLVARTHNAGVGGSSPPLATIFIKRLQTKVCSLFLLITTKSPHSVFLCRFIAAVGHEQANARAPATASKTLYIFITGCHKAYRVLLLAKGSFRSSGGLQA